MKSLGAQEERVSEALVHSPGAAKDTYSTVYNRTYNSECYLRFTSRRLRLASAMPRVGFASSSFRLGNIPPIIKLLRVVFFKGA